MLTTKNLRMLPMTVIFCEQSQPKLLLLKSPQRKAKKQIFDKHEN